MTDSVEYDNIVSSLALAFDKCDDDSRQNVNNLIDEIHALDAYGPAQRPSYWCEEFDSDTDSMLEDAHKDELRQSIKKKCLLLLMSAVVVMLSAIKEVDIIARGALVYRDRPEFNQIAGHLLQMNSFQTDIRMSYMQFIILKQAITPECERNPIFGGMRNSRIEVDIQLFVTLRVLAGAQVTDVKMICPVQKSTVYAVVQRVVRAINNLKTVDALQVRFPSTEAECKVIAEGFRLRSTHGIISHCVGCVDGLFIKTKLPSRKKVPCRKRMFLGHKMALGLNCQAICDFRYRFTAFSCSSYGSVHDKRALDASGLLELINALPSPYYVNGDNAYIGTDKMLDPCPGNNLGMWWDAYNYYQSQTRMHIEQTFGIFVRKWGILWKAIEYCIFLVPEILLCLARLHNYCIGDDDIDTSKYLRVNMSDADWAAINSNNIFVDSSKNRFQYERRVNNDGYTGETTDAFKGRVRKWATFYRNDVDPKIQALIKREIEIVAEQDKALRRKSKNTLLATHIAGQVEESGNLRPQWNIARNAEEEE